MLILCVSAMESEINLKRNIETSDTLTVVLTRMTSSRLPGKALIDIGGIPNLKFMLSRVKKAQHAGAICVATTTNAIDDAIVTLCKNEPVNIFPRASFWCCKSFSCKNHHSFDGRLSIN
jgi:hypothetical protein